MSETLEITKEAALKAHKVAHPDGKAMLENLFGRDVFKLKITDRVKIPSDALAINGGTWNPPSGLSHRELCTRHMEEIAKALNEEWVADYTDRNQPKWTVWLTDYKPGVGFSAADVDCWYSHTTCGVRLCFRSREIAEYAAKQFFDLFKGMYE